MKLKYMNSMKLLKNFDLSKSFDDKNTMLRIALISVFANTQKLSYVYMQRSFDFKQLSEQTTFDTFCFVGAWLLTICIVISFELSILMFIQKGVRFVGGLFSVFIFLINLYYFDSYHSFSIQFSIDIIISLLSPVCVYVFSNLYVKEHSMEKQANKDILIEQEQAMRKQVEIEKELLEKQLQLINKQKEEQRSFLQLEIEQHNEVIKQQAKTIEQHNEVIKQQAKTIEQNKLLSKQLISEKEQLLANNKENLARLKTWELAHTCEHCGTAFDTKHQLAGHLAKCSAYKIKRRESQKNELSTTLY